MNDGVVQTYTIPVAGSSEPSVFVLPNEQVYISATCPYFPILQTDGSIVFVTPQFTEDSK